MSILLEEIEKLLEPILSSEGMELVDVEYRREPRGWTLRIYLDKEGGVTVKDCSRVSGHVGQILEVKDLIGHPYILEVSSPGLDRRLKKEKDFLRFCGETVRIQTTTPLDKQTKFMGRLLGMEDGNVRIECDGKHLVIPLLQVGRAYLVYRF